MRHGPTLLEQAEERWLEAVSFAHEAYHMRERWQRWLELQAEKEQAT